MSEDIKRLQKEIEDLKIKKEIAIQEWMRIAQEIREKSSKIYDLMGKKV